MEEHKSRTKAHYNHRTLELNQTVDKIDMDMKILRNFHNKIKRALLVKFGRNKDLLIDIGCGRGGDIYKWIDSGIKQVIGIDLSEKEIQEARLRFSQCKQIGTVAEFIQNDRLDIEPVELGIEGKADLVTCMFVIHYFFFQESGIRQLLKNVASYLRPGGHFICCFPDGKRVLSLLGGKEKIKTPCVEIAKFWQNEYQCFGSAYTFSLRGTITETVTEPPFEYLVFFNVLEKLCAEVGLFPVYDYGQELESLFLPEEGKNAFKHFRPDKSYHSLDPSFSDVTKMNVAVVMMKK